MLNPEKSEQQPQTTLLSELGSVLNAISDPIVVFDLEGLAVLANDAIERVFSFDVVGKTIKKLFARVKLRDENDTPLPLEEFPPFKALADGPQVRGRYLYTDDYEDELIIDITASVITAYGVRQGVIMIWDDITDRVHAVQDIRDSRLQVLDILESISDGFFALDNDWRFTYVNKRAAESVGMSREEMLFKNMWEILPETVGTRFEFEYKKAKEQNIATNFEDFYHPVGKWFEVHVYPYNKGLSVYLTDITARRQAEENTLVSSERYARLFENMNEGMILHQMVYSETGEAVDYILENVNLQAERILQLKKEDVAGRKASEIFGTGTAPLLDIYSAVVKTGKPTTFETYFEPLRMYFSVSAFATGKNHFATTFIDITKLRDIEIEREKAIALSMALNEIYADISSAGENDRIIEDIIHKAAKAIGAEGALIALHEDGQWAIRFSYGYPEKLRTQSFTDSDIASITPAGGTNIFVSNNTSLDSRINQAFKDRFIMRSILAAPLWSGDDRIGFLILGHSEPEAFNLVQTDFASKLAAPIALLLKNLELIQELRLSS